MTDTTTATETKTKRTPSSALLLKKIAAKEQALKDDQLKLSQLQVQLEMAEQRKILAMTKGGKKGDTRRKILLGSMLLARIDTDTELRGMLDAYLTRPDDRALFDLTPPPVAPAGE